jgi:hypothetical protein
LEPAAAIVRQYGEASGPRGESGGPGRRTRLLGTDLSVACSVLFAPNSCNA